MRLTLIVLLFASGLASAGTIFVEEPSGTLPTGVTADGIRELVVTAAKGLGHEITNKPTEATAILKPKLIPLGGAYIFGVEKWAAGKLVSFTKLKGRELEELDTLSNRVTRSALNETNAKNDTLLDEVTVQETIADRRKLNRSGTVVAAGPAILSNLHNSGVGIYFSTGKGWAIGPLSLGYRFDIVLDPEVRKHNAMYGDLSLNLTYYFLDRDISPFLTGEFGGGFVRESDFGHIFGGIHLGTTVGVALFRTYGLHLQLGLQGAFLLESAYSTGGTPGLIALRIGASF